MNTITVRPIRTEEDYDFALAEIDRLMDAEANTPEADLLNVWTTLVEAYEDEHYPIPEPEPIEAILYALEKFGLTRDDLIPMIGNLELVNKVMDKKLPLTLEMIRALSNGLDLPADILIQPYPLQVQTEQTI